MDLSCEEMEENKVGKVRTEKPKFDKGYKDHAQCYSPQKNNFWSFSSF